MTLTPFGESQRSWRRKKTEKKRTMGTEEVRVSGEKKKSAKSPTSRFLSDLLEKANITRVENEKGRKEKNSRGREKKVEDHRRRRTKGAMYGKTK